jgi:hypothetical protein
MDVSMLRSLRHHPARVPLHMLNMLARKRASYPVRSAAALPLGCRFAGGVLQSAVHPSDRRPDWGDHGGGPVTADCRQDRLR